MDLQAVAREHRFQVEEFQRKHRIGLLTLLFTDIVGSTRFKQHWGDLLAMTMIQGHHAIVRETLTKFKEAEEISTAGDSFFLVFAKPSDSVKFSLLLQARLRSQARDTARPVFDRIGIHVGEVFIEEGGQKPRDLFGIQVDTCARIMSLGQENQILMSRFAFDNARQILKGQELDGIGELSWLNHGDYRLEGVEDPVEICEVGESGGKSVLMPPASSEKAERVVASATEPVLGWRPAVGQNVPGTNWLLQEKLGEGGFGEVWLGFHEVLKESKVFKFCFRADRVRSLKREVTIFRLLRERVGNHPNIMGVHEVYFDKPPYYIVMDYAGGKDLPAWVAARGGPEKLPLALRLEIIAQAAEGLQAAHEAGVIHRDIKPSNLLLLNSPQHPDQFQLKLTDFGIGQVVSTEALQAITRLGFTQTISSPGSPQTGTMLYMAPELLAGKPASPQSDIYSLGVLFYQLLVGDFGRPLTMDWIKSVDDRLLQDDLVRCFAGNPQDRFCSAAELSESLRNMENRRATQAAEARRLEERLRRAFLLSLLRRAASVLLVTAGLAAAAYFIKDLRAAKFGSVEIKTFPMGAEVWLNGTQIGATPYQAVHLRPGKLTYTLKLPKKAPVETEITIAPKKQTALLVMLEQPTDTQPFIIGDLPAASIPVVVSVEGKVEMAPAGSLRWVLVGPHQVLAPGDRLKTGPGSRVTVRWGDQSTVTFSPNTQIEILPAQSNGRMNIKTRSATVGIEG
jgi:serine/threonine-protein kinase